MYKVITIGLFCIAALTEGVYIDTSPKILHEGFLQIGSPLLRDKEELWGQWGTHIMEFLELIDIDKVMKVVVGHLNDPEILNFLGFVMSPKFRDLIWEFESMAEFKEAFAYLASKGYDVDFIIDYINSALKLPPFERPKILRSKRSMSDFMDDLIAALPLEDMKKLFESKLESSPEIAKLFETINSKEFLDILNKMAQNPKFKEFRTIFESYGFDFKYMCEMAKEIFGDYYQGVFCDS